MKFLFFSLKTFWYNLLHQRFHCKLTPTYHLNYLTVLLTVELIVHSQIELMLLSGC